MRRSFFVTKIAQSRTATTTTITATTSKAKTTTTTTTISDLEILTLTGQLYFFSTQQKAGSFKNVRQGPLKAEKKYLSEKYLLTQKKRLLFDLEALKQREMNSFKNKDRGRFYVSFCPYRCSYW